MKKLSQLIRDPSILFCDLDGTLIETKTGKTFPEDAFDWQFKEEVINAIIRLAPKYLLIVTNQVGIGEFLTVADFERKLDIIIESLKLKTGIEVVSGSYCMSTDKTDPGRKPNTGMFDQFVSTLNLTNKDDMLMIGESDKQFAKNCGISYLDVNDFVKTY